MISKAISTMSFCFLSSLCNCPGLVYLNVCIGFLFHPPSVSFYYCEGLYISKPYFFSDSLSCTVFVSWRLFIIFLSVCLFIWHFLQDYQANAYQLVKSSYCVKYYNPGEWAKHTCSDWFMVCIIKVNTWQHIICVSKMFLTLIMVILCLML